MADAFEDFESDDLTNVPTKRGRDQQRFPCQQCGGTGFYRGVRVHQEKAHCFACRGKGYFLTDQYTRAKAKARAIERKEELRRNVWESFKSEYPDVLEYLEKAAAYGNGFQASLLAQLRSGKGLSEKQTAIAKMKADAWNARRKEARKAREAAPKIECDLSAIRVMFDKAHGNGYKRPTYRAEGLAISLASMSGRNPGALYVKALDNDAYLGKIVGTVFHPTREGEAAKDALSVIAANPLEAAIRFGQRTGRCACCGRELTNHESIELGIGPICREKWGL